MVIIILLFVYRSPVLWIFPILSAVLALGLSSIVIYFLAKNDVVTLNGQSAGIMPVLVLGAGTDYALLLISRYREELHAYPNRFDAMITAWRGSAPAIVASAVTVILGLLCLSFSSLESDKSLGPVGAISIACTLILSMTSCRWRCRWPAAGCSGPASPRSTSRSTWPATASGPGVASKVDRNRRPAWIGCRAGAGRLPDRPGLAQRARLQHGGGFHRHT